jgi:hypothetical protein
MRPPSSPSVSLLPLDSFHLHGKLFTNEFDIRTWNAAPSWEKEIMSISWGLMIDYPMWKAANRKLAGAMFAKDMGFWYLDMAPGWFNHPQILEDIKEVAKIGQKVTKVKKSIGNVILLLSLMMKECFYVTYHLESGCLM